MCDIVIIIVSEICIDLNIYTIVVLFSLMCCLCVCMMVSVLCSEIISCCYGTHAVID